MLYTVSVSDSGDGLDSSKYIFRLASPVEPFYKTASEVATLSYIREHTSIPMPRVIAYSSTAKNAWLRVDSYGGGFWDRSG